MLIQKEISVNLSFFTEITDNYAFTLWKYLTRRTVIFQL